MPKITDSRLLQEIITTEESYNASLKALIDLLDGAVVGDKVAKLNASLKRLHRASSDILQNLNDTMVELSKEEPNELTRGFLAIERQTFLSTFFIQVTTFLPVFTDIQNLLKAATPGHGIAVLDQIIKDGNRGLGIDSVIIKPVQRAMRYKLLLKELVQDEALDNNQKNIVETLLEQACELNAKFDDAQGIIAAEQRAREKAIKGYELGDIIKGNYTFGSVSQRFFGFWTPEPETDDTMAFELVETSTDVRSAEVNTTDGEQTASPLDFTSNM